MPEGLWAILRGGRVYGPFGTITQAKVWGNAYLGPPEASGDELVPFSFTTADKYPAACREPAMPEEREIFCVIGGSINRTWFETSDEAKNYGAGLLVDQKNADKLLLMQIRGVIERQPPVPPPSILRQPSVGEFPFKKGVKQ